MPPGSAAVIRRRTPHYNGIHITLPLDHNPPLAAFIGIAGEFAEGVDMFDLDGRYARGHGSPIRQRHPADRECAPPERQGWYGHRLAAGAGRHVRPSTWRRPG